MRWLAERHHGFPVGAQPHEVVPIVPGGGAVRPAARRLGQPAGRRLRLRGLRSGHGGPVAQGSVGAGTGAKLGSLKGGIGTASVVLPDPDGDIVVGALVAANAAGNAVDPRPAGPTRPTSNWPASSA